MRTCVQRPEEDVGCLNLPLCLIPLRPSFSLNLEVGWQPASLGDPPISKLVCLWVHAATSAFLDGARDLNSGPLCH